MTDEQRQLEQIAAHEQWLAEICQKSEPIDTTRIKQAVRIAVQEQWLAGKVASDVPAGLPERVRHAVRATLTENRSRRIPLWGWIGGGLAVAAAIGLAVIGPWRSMSPLESADEEISYSAAFESLIDEELDEELDSLRDAFSALDQTVSNGWGEDPWDQPLEETPDLSEDGV